MKPEKMTEKRYNKIIRIFAGLNRDLYELVKIEGDLDKLDVTLVVEKGIGVIEYWSNQYLEKVVNPITESPSGVMQILYEINRIDLEIEAAKAWAAGSIEFSPFETVDHADGVAKFLAYTDENKVLAMLEQNGQTVTVPARELKRILN